MFLKKGQWFIILRLSHNKYVIPSFFRCMDMEMKSTDASLVRAYLGGNDRAFEKLYARYERPLFSFILKFVANRQTAEDVFQQTWVKVIKALPKYEERGTFSSWLFGIANNACVDHVRKVARAKIDDFASNEGLDRLPKEQSNQEDQLMAKEKSAWLGEAIESLPEDQKEVVLMRLYGELPFKEIARIVDCPLNTVLGRMHYAVQNLKKYSKETFGVE